MSTDRASDAEPDDSSDEKALVPSESQEVLLPLGKTAQLDLSALPEAERTALQVEYARGQIDINKRAQELGVDVLALDSTLKALAETTQEVSANDDAVTISHTQETSVGRTEVIMGNTNQAQSGKLTKSQTGERDWMPYLIGAGILGATIVGVAIARGG